MQKVKHRIIIDTNLWISFLLTKDFTKIDSLLKGNHIILIFSQELLEEFISVAKRPKFKKYFSLDDIKELLSKINNKAEFVKVKSQVTLCRDANDGKATHLITGDEDILILNKIGKTEILTITNYFKIA